MRDKFLYFLLGCDSIKLRGLGIDRWISRVSGQGIPLADMTREGYTRLSCRIAHPSRPRAEAIARDIGLSLEAAEVSGLPRVWLWLRRKWLPAAAFLLALLLVLAAAGRIWTVELDADLDASLRASLVNALREEGLYPGARRSTVDIRLAEQSLAERFPEMAFISIRLRGVYATVQAVQAVPMAPMENDTAPCSLRAAKGGIVVSLLTSAGTPLVEPGAYVTAGQLLVSRSVVRALPGGDATETVRARGQVLARVVYTASASGILGEPALEDTGKTLVQWRLEGDGGSLRLWGSRNAGYAGYDDRVYILSWVTEKLGWVLVRQEYRQLRANPPLTREALALLLRKRAAHEALHSLGEGVILSRSHGVVLEGDRMTVTCVYIVLENIAVESYESEETPVDR